MTTESVERPTAHWRRVVAKHAEYEPLFPAAMITATDDAMSAFEEDLGRSARPLTDEQVLAVVERFVRALNAVDDVHGRYETGERELLCDYVYLAVKAAGVDVEELAARCGIADAELTGPWRDW